MKKTLVFVTLALAVWLAPSSASACSCVRASAKLYSDGADTIYLAKTSSFSQSKNKFKQEFRVLDTLKGKPAKRFTGRWLLSPCPPEFERAPGKTALLFVSKGRLLSMCEGNIYLSHIHDIVFDLVGVLGGNKRALTTTEHDVAIGAVIKDAKAAKQAVITESVALGQTIVVRGKNKPGGSAFTVILVNTKRSRYQRTKNSVRAVHHRYRYPMAVHAWPLAKP